jgi:hypothetical protein
MSWTINQLYFFPGSEAGMLLKNKGGVKEFNEAGK